MSARWAFTSKKCVDNYLKTLEFFTPYRNAKDFGKTLLSPAKLVLDLAGNFVFGIAFACVKAVVALAAAVSGLCVLPFNTHIGSALLLDSIFAGVTFLGALNLAVFSLLSIAIVPALIVKNITRLAGSIVHAIEACFSKEQEPQEELVLKAQTLGVR